MKLYEFVKAEDATAYDPNEDKINRRERDDTRKDKLTLKDINQLKKIRALRRLEALKKQDILAAMYGQSGGGDSGMSPF